MVCYKMRQPSQLSVVFASPSPSTPKKEIHPSPSPPVKNPYTSSPVVIGGPNINPRALTWTLNRHRKGIYHHKSSSTTTTHSDKRYLTLYWIQHHLSWILFMGCIVLATELYIVTHRVPPLSQGFVVEKFKKPVQVAQDMKQNAFSYYEPVMYDEGSTSNEYSRYALTPGELPGYTGWARPERTLAGYFAIVNNSNYDDDDEQQLKRTTKIGEDWFVTVQCSGHKDCTAGGTLFYLRAYGPAVLTGQVVDVHTDTSASYYKIRFRPMDAGRYTVEVVLTYSSPTPWEVYPLRNQEIEPSYEGHLLPGFPMQILAVHTPTPKQQNRRCHATDFFETDVNGAFEKGRWIVNDKTNSRFHSSITPENSISMRGYQYGVNSLGVSMDYFYENCSNLPYRSFDRPHILDQCMEDPDNTVTHFGNAQPIHVIFIGDSVMRLTVDSFQELMAPSKVSNLKVTFLSTKRGIHQTLDEVKANLTSIAEQSPSNERRYILFNSGLHDVDRLCSSEMKSHRELRMNLNEDENDFSCMELYREGLTELVEFVSTYSAELAVFRSTTAGWLRYGNYGFAWTPDKKQHLSRSTHAVSHINKIAFDVIAKSGNNKIQIIDGYWITLPRPDNTEVNTKQSTGKHLVHPGNEVIFAMTRTWYLLLLQHMCPSTINNIGTK